MPAVAAPAEPKPTARPSAQLPLSAALLVIVASACFSSVDVTVKHLSQRYPVPLLMWARWSVQALIMLAILGPSLRFNLVRTGQPAMQIVRGALLIGSGACFFLALKYLPVADATALNFSAPILVTLMAGSLLGERITRPRWAFVIAGFLGMLLIVRPGSEVMGIGAPFALGAAALYAVFQILTRKLAGEDLMVLLFIPSLVGTLFTSAMVPFFHYSAWYPVADSLLFLLIGLMGFVGHLLFIRAFKVASASAIAPFTYTQLVWSTLAGWAVFGAFPDNWTLAGICVIAGSGIALTWYERWRASLPPAEPVAVD